MIRGWCPTVHAPMPSGDGLLVRVKPFGGRLPAPALAALAAAVAEHGNGVVQLTGRGNLQIRGVRDAPAFARAMVAAGLADPDPVREARRNVIAAPPCDDALVAEVEALLADTPGLPAKFGVMVRGGTIIADDDALRGVADLGSRLAERLAWPRVIPSVPEHTTVMPGRSSHKVPLAQQVEWLRRVDPGIHAVGPATLHDELAPSRTSANARVARNRVDARVKPWHDGTSGHGGILLYLPQNQTTAPTLAHLATIAPEIRTTPWRALLSPVPAPGFLAEPGAITACPGAPACSSATVPAQVDAATLQQAGHRDLHVSGCAKGCAYPHAATTLVGRAGRYDLVRHGRASDPPDLRGLTLAQAMAAL